MKSLKRTVVIALAMYIAPGSLQAGQKEGAWETDIKAAAKLILSNSPKPEEVERNLVLLIDTANKIAVHDPSLPEEFRVKLQAAAKVFAKNPLGTEGGEGLNAAYKILSGGKAFAFPNAVGGIEDIIRVARQHIDQSLKALEQEQSDQAVRAILAFVLLITTPVMK